MKKIYPKVLLDKKLNYQKFKHKETGMLVEAVKYKNGMEDGWQKFPNIAGRRPYVIVCELGFIQKMPVNEKIYIIRYKDYRFVLNSKFFLKKYRRLK